MSTKLRSNPLKSCYNYVKELEEILSSLEHLLSHGKELGLKVAGRNRSRRSERHTPVADASDFCGRGDIKETIIQSLRSADVRGEKIGAVIPIIGAGGIGKTTLAQIIYQHPDVKKHFPEARAWVTVSTEFDLLTIAKKIIGKVTTSQINGNEDQQELLFKLSDALKGKRFLLVLDDVWSEDRGKWNTLKSCFKSAESGSKIIVTTRSRKVASIMAPNRQHHFLQELPEKDCLKLFAQTVFVDDKDRDENPDLQEIGEKIVRKCKGNPLSVVTVGGILCGERHLEKWKKILESSLWELLQEGYEDIIPSLWLSYLYLPSEIKPCFAYCSIFPKDHPFQKEVVVRLWMAEGFLKNGARKTVEEVGEEYFEELISRSLFQRSKGWDRECFIMHDLVHDLAMKVSGEFCFCLEVEKNLLDLSCKTRYLSCNMQIQDVKNSEDLSKARRLHSFVGLRGPYSLIPPNRELGILKVLAEVSVEGACLRVLSLSHYYGIDSLRDSLGKLKQLRYLDLSYSDVRELPDSVCTLYNLQTLLLVGCRNLTQLPESIGNLKQLRYLDLSDSGVRALNVLIVTLGNFLTLRRNLTLLPESIGNLKQLRYLDLSNSDVRELPDSIGTLDNLQTLHSAGCRNLTQLPESIGNLKQLRFLDLSNSNVRELPDSIGTLDNLQTLLLVGCINLTQLPESIGNLKQLRYLDLSKSDVRELPDSIVTLDNLQTLLLVGCINLTLLPINEGNLINLHRLDISDSPKLEFLGNCRYGSLKDWKIVNCKALKCIRLDYFPKLNELELKGLKCLSELTGKSSNEIKRLFIEECPKLEFLGNCRYGSLKDWKIVNCKALKCIRLDYFPKLNELELKGLKCLSELTGKSSNEIKRLFIEECPKLEFLGNCRYGSLKDWKIVNCKALKCIRLDYFPKLNELELKGLKCLSELTGKSSNEIKRLFIEECPKLEFLGNCRYGSLKDWKIVNCKALKCIRLDYFPKLNELELKGLKCLSELTGKSSNEIKRLFIEECPKLEFLGNCRYGSLKDLKIVNCKALKWIPLDYFPKLNELKLKGLKCLSELTGESSNEIKRLFIEECPKLEVLGNCRYGSLKDLTIVKCEALKWIPLDYFPKLNELELKGLECLSELTGESSNEIKRLFIEKCPKLEVLGNCRYGSLKDLEIVKCEALKWIPLDYFPKLNQFAMWLCENFESFRFAEEPPLVLESLTLLKLECLPKFVSFPEGGLPAPNLEKFCIVSCESLRRLPQQMHKLLPSLKDLEVSNCGEIESWPEGGLPSNLKSLGIWECKKLVAQVMHWDLQVTCLKELDIDGCGEELLDSFPPEGFLPTSLTSLYIGDFRRLKTLNIHAFQDLKKLDVFHCDELQCLPEESLPNSLEELTIYECPLLERRYRKETGEGWHKISHIPKVCIDGS